MLKISKFYSYTKKSNRVSYFLIKTKNLWNNVMKIGILSRFSRLASHAKIISRRREQLVIIKDVSCIKRKMLQISSFPFQMISWVSKIFAFLNDIFSFQNTLLICNCTKKCTVVYKVFSFKGVPWLPLQPPSPPGSALALMVENNQKAIYIYFLLI